ncbi:MerR family transcriptional regulator [Streptomyces griseobrunneus]
MADWPIAAVARMSGVTARTLRHYDGIGLLPPARIGSNGHRPYEERQLLRLQQILVLRELGVGLPELMAAGADAGSDAVLDEADGQYRSLTGLSPVSADEFRAIGRSCVDDEQWRDAYESIAPGLAAYQCAAFEAYVRAGCRWRRQPHLGPEPICPLRRPVGPG